MLRRLVGERGESAPSYLAVILLLASVVAVALTAAVPNKIVEAVSSSVCKVAQGGCEGSGDAPPTFRQPPASGTPSAESPEQRAYREAEEALERVEREASAAEAEWNEFDLFRELAALGLDFLIGDIKKCIEDPSFGDCLWALLNVVPWSKIGTFLKAVPKLIKLADRFIGLQNRLGRVRQALADARSRLDQAREACRRTRACQRSLREIAETADLSSPRDGALFWTGLPEAEANRIAGRMSGMTLEQTLRDRGIDLPPWQPNDPELSEVWSIVSRRFAESASGEVRLVAGPNPRPDSDWLNIELPALKENPNVTRIIQIDARTGAEKVIFER